MDQTCLGYSGGQFRTTEGHWHFRRFTTDGRNRLFVRNAASSGTRCEYRKQAVLCRLESHYLGYDIAPQVCLNDLFQPSSQIKLYHKERLLPSCGVLDSNKSSQFCFGWLTELNIDSLIMALCGISDIRRINGLKNLQFQGLEVRLLVYCPFFFCFCSQIQ